MVLLTKEKEMSMELRHGAQLLAESVKIALELGRDTTPHIDAQFMAIAEREAAKDGGLFSVIDRELLEGPNRPDAIRHDLTLLQPNAVTNQEIADTLFLVDLMLGEQVPEITEQFAAATDKVGIFERLQHDRKRASGKLIVVSNHLELSDQGFTMGFLHKAAEEHGVERLENYLTAVIGRVVGYFNFTEKNVIDGILRKAGSILKTFPSGGSEALTEDEQKALRLFREICNHHTKQAFAELIGAQNGRIITMAPSGEQDRYDAEENVVRMRSFGKGTCNMIIDACMQGATVLPVFVDYGPSNSIVEFLDTCSPTSIDACHEIGQQIAAVGTEARANKAKELPDEKRFAAAVSYN